MTDESAELRLLRERLDRNHAETTADLARVETQVASIPASIPADRPVGGTMSGTSWPPDIPAFYAGQDAVSQLNVMAQSLSSLLNPPVFRAERSTAFTVASGHQYIPWSTPLEDTYGGWGPSQTPAQTADKYIAPAAGWYHVQAAVSLSGTGASGLVLIPAVAVAGTSPTGQGSAGWEGPEVFVPTGSASQPKIVSATWPAVYANAGDPIQIDLWYSTESAITSVDTTAGIRCRVGIVGVGV